MLTGVTIIGVGIALILVGVVGLLLKRLTELDPWELHKDQDP